MEYGNKIFKLVQFIKRNDGKPDLHSFTGRVKGGFVYVEATPSGIHVKHQMTDCAKWHSWTGAPIAATNRLEMLGLDLDSVRI